jgi:hypothetical protein
VRRSLVWFACGLITGALLLWLVMTLMIGWYVYVPITSERDPDHYASLGCEPQAVANRLWMKCPRRLYWTAP